MLFQSKNKTISVILLGLCFFALSLVTGSYLQWEYDLIDRVTRRFESFQQSKHIDYTRVYENKLLPIVNPNPIFDTISDFIVPIDCPARFESHPLINDEKSTISVRSWRYSYHARGIVEMSNFLDGSKTALIVVHPWGINDGQGWKVPEPAGVSFFGTTQKNKFYIEHTRQVLAPFIQKMKDHVQVIVYTLPGNGDELRSHIYSTFNEAVDPKNFNDAIGILHKTLLSHEYVGNSIPQFFRVDAENSVTSYFKNFPGINGSEYFNGHGYRNLPIPIVKTINCSIEDIVFYDGKGYNALKNQLCKKGIRHILLAGYATDLCVKATTAGYLNLKKDFNVILVGDATMASYPAMNKPAMATTTELAKASLDTMMTEISWISILENNSKEKK